jgi:spore coat protein SA
MIYYLLDEPFSTITGLAISRIIASMMSLNESSTVVCPQADDTWGFSPNRIRMIRQLHIANIRGWRLVPLWVRRQLICLIFRPVLSQLRAGDIVWCNNWPLIAEALEPAIHLKGAKLIYHAHNSLVPYVERGLFKSFIPDALIFVSEAIRQEALGLMPYLKNTYTIHNGADETLFYPRTADASQRNSVPIILYVGRLVQIKGVHVLMEAMRILQERKISAICKVVGSSHAGGSRNKATTYVRSLQKHRPTNVQFEGFRSATDVAHEYRAADIVCCPSISMDAFPGVPLEAMACGVPVVATRVGGVPEIAAEGGVLLVEADSAVDLADALQKLIRDKDLRIEMGAEGLTSFQQRFAWDVIVKQYWELIDNI